MRYLTIAFAALCGLIAAEAKAGPAENVSGLACSLVYTEPLAYTSCLAATATVKEAGGCLLSSDRRECFGEGNTLRQQTEKIIVGPIQDIRNCRIGSSPESLWRKLGGSEKKIC